MMCLKLIDKFLNKLNGTFYLRCVHVISVFKIVISLISVSLVYLSKAKLLNWGQHKHHLSLVERILTLLNWESIRFLGIQMRPLHRGVTNNVLFMSFVRDFTDQHVSLIMRKQLTNLLESQSSYTHYILL